ncbi:NUDIX hydrolase [Amphiplicatus metriothermophilus]|uniref:Nudix hydrolase domain-containing protein n=1 Tax=Amphiplicatus metriothermophilus TaxID=1519374 RepID=A0A239PX31_9PROT|nr:hypothetical protein [Amphiplicatus metriothermophilus]MBB5519980.1 8-oxo-dGTP pyrophosphatase MutT (NUDIX family) [Amphiplicatus metriothermophilus]SNT74879.1 hypothetical protein SAMN06297382_2470 [Amphiplicatus metriothermophilus]
MSNERPIPAATILILRDAPAFQVLMVERHADISFAGGALVFPGGRIDPGDRDPAWAAHLDGCETRDPAMRAGMIAAARETFEETGILLARQKGRGPGAPLVDGARAAALDPLRRDVERDDGRFLEMIRAESLALACDRLVLFARWIAPPGLHKRFDTLFFAAARPEGQEAREDGDETTEALWIEPESALAARERGTRRMIFPTARNVELLAVSRSTAEALDWARRRRIEPVQPKVVARGGVEYLTIPDDLGYPVTEEPLETALRG